MNSSTRLFNVSVRMIDGVMFSAAECLGVDDLGPFTFAAAMDLAMELGAIMADDSDIVIAEAV